MPKGKVETPKEAQRKALREAAYKRDTKLEVKQPKVRAKQVGKLSSVKASARSR